MRGSLHRFVLAKSGKCFDVSQQELSFCNLSHITQPTPTCIVLSEQIVILQLHLRMPAAWLSRSTVVIQRLQRGARLAEVAGLRGVR